MTHLSEAILHDTTGIILTIQDPLIATWLHDHVDFFVIDAAARPFAPGVIQSLITAAKDKPVFVRAEDNAPATLQHYQQLGADGLILTHIHYAAEAEKAIAACLYPPEGVRPYRLLVETNDISLQAINDQLTLIIEVAHPQTIAQIEEIAEVTGVNGLLLAPQRLAVAMEKNGDATHVAVQQAMQAVVLAARSYDLPCGLEAGEGALPDFTPHFRLPHSDAQLLINGLQKTNGFVKAAFQEDEEIYLTAIR